MDLNVEIDDKQNREKEGRITQKDELRLEIPKERLGKINSEALKL